MPVRGAPRGNQVGPHGTRAHPRAYRTGAPHVLLPDGGHDHL